MFDIFDWFISSHPHIPVSLGSCALACILQSSRPHTLLFVCTCLYPRILTSSYLQVHMPLLESLHLHILRFISVSLYTRILLSSYPQIHVCLLVSLHPHIFISSSLCVLVGILTSSHPSILRFMCAY